MGGSLLSKFRRRRGKIAPLNDRSAEPTTKQSRTETLRTEKNVFEEQTVVAERPSVVDGALANCADSVNKVLKSSPSVLQAKVLEDFEEIVRQAKKEARVLESAREILAAQSSLTSSHGPSTRAVTPRDAVNTHSVSLGETPASTAFEILLGERRTICAAARMPRRLRRLEQPPQLTAEAVAKKMKVAERKRLKALERTRAAAKVKKTEHPAVELSRKTAQKISDKMSKAHSKRSEVIEAKKQAGQKASRAKRKIADAQVYAQEQIKSSIEEKRKRFEMRQVEYSTQMADKKRRREAHARMVKEKARMTVPEEEPDVPVGLELEADELYCASDGDESWDTEGASLWKDFGF